MIGNVNRRDSDSTRRRAFRAESWIRVWIHPREVLQFGCRPEDSSMVVIRVRMVSLFEDGIYRLLESNWRWQGLRDSQLAVGDMGNARVVVRKILARHHIFATRALNKGIPELVAGKPLYQQLLQQSL